MLKGAITAIVTPFKNGQLDEAAYRELIEFQIQGGINGIVPCGTTGESPTLSHAEHKRVVEICHRPGEKTGAGDRRRAAPTTPPNPWN